MKLKMSALQDNTCIGLYKTEYNNNSVVLSALTEFYQPVSSKGFAIKYVAAGTEMYKLGKEHYQVEAGAYLLSNSNNEGHVEIDSKKVVQGICINIAPALLAEVAASLRRPDTAFADNELGSFFNSSLFVENIYHAGNTYLGKELTRVGHALKNDPHALSALSPDFFYRFSEAVITDQLPVFRQLQAMPGIKSATKKELYKKVARGREFIDSAFSLAISVETIAREACMSEYHFFRLFKLMYGVSPHQYILRKRLEYGKLLLTQQLTVSATALECGFADIYTFSKAFRNHFGIAPSTLLIKNQLCVAGKR